MSDFDVLLSAAGESQTQLVQQRGMPQGSAGNALYAGQSVTVLFGTPQMEDMPLVAGGYRRRVFLSATATKTQTNFTPLEKTKLTRLVPDKVEYTIDRIINPHDPFLWHMDLVRVGPDPKP